MQLEKVREYCQCRKWYQMCQEIMRGCNSKEEGYEAKNIIDESILQIHPTSLSEVCVLLSYSLEISDSIKLIEAATESIDKTTMYSGDFEVPKIALRIRRSQLDVVQGNLNHIERCIYELKGAKLPCGVAMMYNLLGYSFYNSTGNIDEAFKYLYKYIKDAQDNTLIDELILGSMRSHSFYDFSLILTLPAFQKCQNSELKELFISFASGKTDIVEKNSAVLDRLFGDQSVVIKEKVYMIALTNLCFSCTEKVLSYDTIEQELGIKFDMAAYFTLKAMGLDLISGWMDGRNRMLYLRRVMPRNLPVHEILKMKDKFSEWRCRVGEVLKMLE